MIDFADAEEIRNLKDDALAVYFQGIEMEFVRVEALAARNPGLSRKGYLVPNGILHPKLQIILNKFKKAGWVAIPAAQITNASTGKRNFNTLVNVWKGKDGMQGLEASHVALSTTESALRNNYEDIPSTLVVSILTADGTVQSAAVVNAIAALGPGFEGISDEQGRIKFVKQDTDVSTAVDAIFASKNLADKKA